MSILSQVRFERKDKFDRRDHWVTLHKLRPLTAMNKTERDRALRMAENDRELEAIGVPNKSAARADSPVPTDRSAAPPPAAPELPAEARRVRASRRKRPTFALAGCNFPKCCVDDPEVLLRKCVTCGAPHHHLCAIAHGDEDDNSRCYVCHDKTEPANAPGGEAEAATPARDEANMSEEELSDSGDQMEEGQRVDDAAAREENPGAQNMPAWAFEWLNLTQAKVTGVIKREIDQVKSDLKRELEEAMEDARYASAAVVGRSRRAVATCQPVANPRRCQPVIGGGCDSPHC